MDRVRPALICGLLCLLLAGLAACNSSTPSTTNTSTVTLSGIALNPPMVNGGQSSTATVTLSGPAPSGGAQVTLTTSNGSVVLPSSQMLTIPQGAMSGTFQIQTLIVGSNQVAQISATYLLTATVQASLSIVSTNPLSISTFTVSPTTLTSGQSTIGTITLSAPAFSPGQQVLITSSDISRVQPQNPVTVTTNATTATFNIFTSASGSPHTVMVTASLNATSIPVQLTLQPAGPAITSLLLVPFTAAGGSNLTGTVTISAPAPMGGMTVQLAAAFSNPATPAGTVLPITVPMSVPVPQGAVQAQFTAHTSAVTKTTGVVVTASLGTNQVSLTECLANPLLPGCSFVTIVPSLALAGINCVPATLTTGNTGVCSVSLNIPAPAGGQAVQLSSNNATALPLPSTSVNGSCATSVTVAAGMSVAMCTVTAGTPAATANVTLTASLQGATTGSVTTMVTVVPVSAITVSAFTLSATTVQGGAGLTGTVTISAPAPPGGLVINLTSSNTGVANFASGSTVTVPQNMTTVSLGPCPPVPPTTACPITTMPVGSSINVTLTASVNSSSMMAMLAVVPPPVVASLTLNPASVAGGNSTTATVTLQSAAPQGGATVTIQSSSTLAQAASVVTVPAGSTTANFTVTTLPVTIQQNVTITATIGTLPCPPGPCSSQQATLTLLPPPADMRLLFFNPATVTSGGTSTGTVVLTTPAPAGGTTVMLTSGSTTVVLGSTTIMVPAGAKSANFTATAGSVTTSTSVQVTGKVTASAQNSLTIIPAPAATFSEQIVTAGETNSIDFPIHGSNPAQSVLGGSDTGFATSIALSTSGGSTASSFTFSTYLGGKSSFGQVRDVFVDSSGNVFACGVTTDPNLPTTMNAAQPNFGGGQDVFVAELNPTTGALLYLSYLGGSGDETCYSVAFDSSSNTIIVAGKSTSTNLPGTAGAFQTANAGGNDFFVARINPTGTSASTRLVWLTFLGGIGEDFADGRIAVNAAGVIAVSGTSQSTALPPNGFPTPSRPNLNGVGSFGVVIQLSSDGTQLLTSTFLFGTVNGANAGSLTTTTASGGVLFDSSSNLYVCGQTNATDLPVSPGAFQAALKGGQNGYVARLNSSGAITALTYLGGTSTSTTQACKGLAFDAERNVVVVMPTDAADYPATVRATPGGPVAIAGPPVLSGPSDFAITKLTSDFTTLVFSALVGGSGSESADATRVELDASENLYFSLATNSGDFPVTGNAVQGAFAGTSGGSNTNVAVVKLSADGSTILYSTFLGGSSNNSTTSVRYRHN